MLCAACGHDESRVIKTREDERNESIHRVRECRSCGHVWRTLEREVKAKGQEGEAA